VTDVLEEVGVEDESKSAAEQLHEACTVWPGLSPIRAVRYCGAVCMGHPEQKDEFPERMRVTEGMYSRTGKYSNICMRFLG
jgi:hypothetical protein